MDSTTRSILRAAQTRNPRVAVQGYQRAYKACIPCRQRKAKCDLGTGVNQKLIGPPCARCRREKKECVFSQKKPWERIKKRGNESPPRTRRGISNSSCSQDGQPVALDGTVSPAGSLQSNPNGRIHQDPTSAIGSTMIRTVVSSGNDALNILFEAATAAAQDQGNDDNNLDDQAVNGPNLVGHNSDHRGSLAQAHSRQDPTIVFESTVKSMCPVDISQASQSVIDVWETCRFVRMGWFNATEAVTYIDLFFKNMSPLSPILSDFYANHKNHRLLISQNPLLCCTILMISSRYHLLPGVGGESRKFFIHHRLWQHCQQLVMRLIFGQEKAPVSKIRTIGTIEALLLISEWHPRALHFPPETDGWDLDLTTLDSQAGMNHNHSTTSENGWLENVIEPARRSDQMSWMLLGSALSLAHEIGIFETENNKRTCFSGCEECISNGQIECHKQRVQKLLYIYINQLAWRIGCMSLLPQSLNHAILSGKTATRPIQSRNDWLTFMDSWMDLTKLAKSVTDTFIPSVSVARQQLHSDRYIGLLDNFRPLLGQWKEKHLQANVLNKPLFDILYIEYHFVCVYTHSVGMQAAVERILADMDPNSNDVEKLRHTTMNSLDYEFINEVINGCCQILQKVTQLAKAGTLRFSPVRIFLRITSSSIFLMRALSLGTRQSKLEKSIDILEGTIQALRSNALDDIHLGTRYATLLDMHVERLRQKLLASSTSMRDHRGPTRQPSMSYPPQANGVNETTISVDTSQDTVSDDDITMYPLNNMTVDNWLSLPFDPSMAPFGIGSSNTNEGHFPAYEGGAMDFIWNMPS